MVQVFMSEVHSQEHHLDPGLQAESVDPGAPPLC